MSIDDYTVQTSVEELNGAPDDLTHEQLRWASDSVMNGLFDKIEALPPPREIVSHNVAVIGNRLVATAIIRLLPQEAHRDPVALSVESPI